MSWRRDAEGAHTKDKEREGDLAKRNRPAPSRQSSVLEPSRAARTLTIIPTSDTRCEEATTRRHMLAHVAPFEALRRRQRGHRPGSFSSPSSGGGLAPWALHRGLSPGGSGFQRELHVEAGVNGPGPSRGLFSQFRARPEFKFEFRPRDRSTDGIRTSPNTPKRVALHEPQGPPRTRPG